MSKKVFRFLDVIGDKEYFINKDIEIISVSPDDDVSFNANMRGKIINMITLEEGTEDEHIEIIIDFKTYESYNIPLMDRCFYDDKQQPVLTWKESAFYKNGIDSIYVMTSPASYLAIRDDVNLFSLVNEKQAELYELFKASGKKHYIEFLEDIAL